MSDALFPNAPGGASSSAGYTVLARRYRSTGFDELVGQEPIVHALQNAIAHGRTSHAYLFTGTRGVGKTSMARIFAKALNCVPELKERDQIAAAILRGDDIDVIEIDGASNRGIDKARELIASAGILPARCPYKIYIIDEVHMLTKEAFNALLKLMEEPPPHVKFILCTTDPNAVPATIQSRCQRFDFRNIGSARIAEHLRHVVELEKITAEDDVLHLVARLANGSMRDALSLLDRLIAASDGRLTQALLEQVLGLPDRTLIEELVDAIADSDAPGALRRMHELLQRGHGVEQAIDALADQFRAVMLCAVVGPDTAMVDRAGESLDAVRRQATRFDAPALVHAIALCDAVSQHARHSSIPRALLDSLIVRLALAEHFVSISAALEGEAPPPMARPAGAGGTARSSSTARAAGATASAATSRRPAGDDGDEDEGDLGKKKDPASATAEVKTHAPSTTLSVEDDRAPRTRWETMRPGAPMTAGSPARTAVAPSARPVATAEAPGTPVSAAHSPLRAATGTRESRSTAPDRGEALDAAWQALLGAVNSSREQVLLDELRPSELRGDTLVVRLASPDSPLASFLQASTDSLQAMAARVSGRRLRIELDLTSSPAPAGPAANRAPASSSHHAAASDPVVRTAIELFDATITGISPRRSRRGSGDMAADGGAPDGEETTP